MLDTIRAWTDPALAAALGWYREVASNRRPAKYLIARRVRVELAGDLWAELDRATAEFLGLWAEARQGRPLGPVREPNLTHLAARLARGMLSDCNFCRWNCRVDRARGTRHGTCQLAGETRVASYFHHQGEELVYRGREGSGTVFFTSCNMRCGFCQNGDISTDKENGTPVTSRQLAAIAWQLRQEGCHNVNWVGGEPTIHLHTILEAISLLEAGLPSPPRAVQRDFQLLYDSRHPALYRGEPNIPMLWNSNFFMSEPAMRLLRVTMDLWLPDFKFGPGPCGVKLSRTPWYWETVTGNLERIHSWGEDFTIRHLVMPSHVECCTFPILEWLHRVMPQAPVNLMDQFHPDCHCDPASPGYNPRYADISRRLRPEEFHAALRRAGELGLPFRTLSLE